MNNPPQVAWCDDDRTVIERTRPFIEDVFENIIHQKPVFKSFDNGADLLKCVTENEIDFAFLDIDLGNPNEDGIIVYNKLRKLKNDLGIAFVSGNLTHVDWDQKVKQLKENDQNLQSINIPFPSKGDVDFKDRVSDPIEKLIKWRNPKRPISINTIHAKIIEIKEEQLLVNCLLDIEQEQYQLRKFDIEPFTDAVTLEEGQVITIKIITSIGERKFLFKDAKEEAKKHFEEKNYFDGSEDFSNFLNPPKDDHNL